MIPFLLRRAVAAVVLVAIVCTAAFFLLFAVSSDPTSALLGNNPTDAQRAALRAQLGLDQPVYVQYLRWIGGALHGDLGMTWSGGQPVLQVLATRLPVTLSIVIGALILSAAVGIVAGLYAGVHQGTAVDRTILGLSVAGFALPSFWICLLLVYFFAITLHWLPATGYVPIERSIDGWLSSIILPVVALSLGCVAALAQTLRTSTIEVYRQDFVRTLRCRGLSERRILFTHVLRNAAPAGLTVLSLQFVGLIGGAVVVESIFALPGIGSFASRSTMVGDLPAVLGVVVVSVIVVVVVNLLLDLAVAWINPKARLL
ncbi:peptide/nickel transport system permease protein [Microbacterium sp. SORGH_AS 1204]|uniref:ABC transporter permease n=1 Tax=Microbacterium sp. SORGH_AS_1204 TaxID=3041785 RepID=UPI002793AAA2|nr:ABC transporter permease [Microbacterium sp. SORGH_AS_1204]MDQ1136304.1 peptide/nickel transport system permease protein [Microbacterium sp. SORGH_AS_1204]